MKTTFEKHPHIDSEEAKAVESVLKVIENLFFSMPIPDEIMDKYNYLKENKFKRAGLEFVPITKLQYPTIGTVPKSGLDFGKSQDIEDIFCNLYDDQVTLFEAVFNYIAERGASLAEQSKNPMRSPYSSKSHSTDYSITINELKAKIMRTLKDYQQKKAMSIPTEKSQSLKITELTSKSLPELGSQMLYKVEISQNKILSTLDNIEDSIIKQEGIIKALKQWFCGASDSHFLI